MSWETVCPRCGDAIRLQGGPKVLTCPECDRTFDPATHAAKGWAY